MDPKAETASAWVVGTNKTVKWLHPHRAQVVPLANPKTQTLFHKDSKLNKKGFVTKRDIRHF